MKRLIINGALILIFGSLIYPFLVDEISGLSQALIIGLMVGSTMALRSQLGKKIFRSDN